MNISTVILLVSEGLELDHLMAYAGASEDHVSGLRAEGASRFLNRRSMPAVMTAEKKSRVDL